MLNKFAKIVQCTPSNPDYRWYEDKIGEIFAITNESVLFIMVWDGKCDRLILKEDVAMEGDKK